MRLLLKVDDYGNIYAANRYLRPILFPNRNDVRETDFADALAELSRLQLIRFYKGPDDARHLHVPKFNQNMRWKKRLWPPAPFESEAALRKERTKEKKEVEGEVVVVVEGHEPRNDNPSYLHSLLHDIRADIHNVWPSETAKTNAKIAACRGNEAEIEKVYASFRKKIGVQFQACLIYNKAKGTIIDKPKFIRWCLKIPDER